jgi:hypothetical protein
MSAALAARRREVEDAKSKPAVVYDETRRFYRDEPEMIELPVKLVAALMMMIGDDRIKVRVEDVEAAAEWRRGREIQTFWALDSATDAYVLKLGD